ncbi:general odorant-binding protein 56d-like [Topomyia yanbarensis]|uniref:general odorant-binding protein 56d-like n=1 Tax=Topomyia yanbarensis TaxID=2498891 RepID=UPI00273CAF3D|nr:general odorant-binding protein 56d-like [Topomyia yanbarensis]
MKSFIFIALIVAVVGVNALTEEQLQKASAVSNECLSKSDGVEKDDVEKLRQGDFSSVDQNIKCFAKCFLERIGFMDAGGNLVDAFAIERLSLNREKDKVEALVKRCSVKQSDPCETAFRAFECFYNEKSALF